MEPASSDSDFDSDPEEHSQSSTSSSPSIIESNFKNTSTMNNNNNNDEIPVYPSIDDLPTDDSGSELDSSSEDDEDDSSSEHDDDNDEFQEVTLEERLKSRQQHGLPQMKHSKPNSKSNATSNSKPKQNQHAPKEVSSKRSDYFRRGAPILANNGIATEASGGVHRYKARDPRMESLNGHFDQGAFDHNYSFLEEIQQTEIQTLRERISAHKLKGRKGQRHRKKLGMTPMMTLQDDETELQRLLQLRANQKRIKLQTDTKRAMKRKMTEELKSGQRQREYYYKKKDLKRMELEIQYDLMKKQGGDKAIDKLLAKRRKKNLGRDGKFMPSKNA